MPLGLPNHLAPLNVSRAYSRAAHTVAYVCLFGAIAIAVIIQLDRPALILWPAILAAVPFLLALWLLDRRRTTFFAVTYLAVGGACMYLFALAGSFEVDFASRTDTFVLSLPKVALIMVGAGSGVYSLSAWAIAGFVVGEGVTILAALRVGADVVFDGTTAITLLLCLAILWLIALNQRVTNRAQSGVTRAARDEQLSVVRYRIEAKAAAVMHDTVLNHLAALSIAEPGPLSPTIRTQMTRDLEVLIGEEWLLDAAAQADGQESAEWRHTSLFEAIAEARSLGLDVTVSGDVTALERVEPQQASALALAAKQCLINVLRHSGTTNAEVVVYGSEREASVMVVDTGKGFSEEETGSDRLGLRQSVRFRIQAVGGDVQVWSTPGRGTSVMIRVPVASPRSRATASPDATARQ